VPDEQEQLDAGTIEDLELDDAESDDVAGGRSPAPPAGPVPIPYPN
jgi:hypothetical protein